MSEFKINSKEFALLRCGIVVGPIAEIDEKIFVIGSNSIKIEVSIKIKQDGVPLRWDLRGKNIMQWMSDDQLDIIERFLLIRGDEDGKGMHLNVNTPTD